MLFGILWMGSQAFVPAILGKAIDQGIAAGDTERLLLWTTALFGVGVLQALAGIMRHRFAVVNWLSGAYRTVQVVTRKSADLGATLPKNLATGEVVSVGMRRPGVHRQRARGGRPVQPARSSRSWWSR